MADAGQANDSAVNYYFGSRAGLLAEILHRGVASMEEERSSALPGVEPGEPAVHDVVGVVVRPLVDLVETSEGRDFLRVAAQVGAFARVGRTLSTGPVAGTALERQMELLVTVVAERVGSRRARERVRMMVLMLTVVLAVRSVETESGSVESTHADFVDDLVLALVAGLVTGGTEPPGPTGADRRDRSGAEAR